MKKKPLLTEGYKMRLQELAAIGRTTMLPKDIYFDTLGETMDFLEGKMKEKNFVINSDDIFNFTTGGITYGSTKRQSFVITKADNPNIKKMLHVQIYRMDSGKYELNFYIA